MSLHSTTSNEGGAAIVPVGGASTATDQAFWYELITEEPAAEFLNLTPRKMQKDRQVGGGPKFIRISARCIRYRRIDLREYAEARMVSNTSEADPELNEEAPSTANANEQAQSDRSMIGHNSRGRPDTNAKQPAEVAPP